MKKLLLFLLALGISNFLSAQTVSIRRGLFNSKQELVRGDNTDQYSMLSLGTMFGISYSLEDMTTYKVRDGVVIIDKKGTISDRFLPAVYAFPSLSLLGKPGKSLSMIVPVNLSPSSDFALGIGFSYGFNTFKNSAEVGIALVGIWSEKEKLNDAQQFSFDNKTALPSNESSEFSKSKVISIGLGIYVVPLFK